MKTFSMSRFQKVLTNDLKNILSNEGLTILIFGLLPLIWFAFYQIIYLLSSGQMGENSQTHIIGAYITAFISCMMLLPSKEYGAITEKKYGTNFILTPASTFEKWLSIIVTSCVIIPAALFTLLLASDGILSLLFPNAYGGTVLTGDQDIFRFSIDNFVQGTSIGFSPLVLLWVGWIENILAFVLGSVVFKKGKIGKTFLCLAGLGMLASLILLAIIGQTSFSGEDIERLLDTTTPGTIKAVLYAGSLITSAVYASLLYLRLKTLKH